MIRPYRPSDLDALAAIRALEWGDKEYWTKRISGYINRTSNPGGSLDTRTILVFSSEGTIAGMIAGHATTRYNCQGELQWLNVHPDYRHQGVATALLDALMSWYVENDLTSVCVNADPDNTAALSFYRNHGASSINTHWLVWNDIRKHLQG